jgi:hypothetical protein
MKILVKFPTRSRQNKFFNVLKKYHQYCNNIDNLIFQITLDNDDIEMNNPDTIEILKTFKNTTFVFGDSKSKIDAVNRDINTDGDWDVILLASDDMIPNVKGYDEIIINKMKELYPDTDGVLWFNDGFQGQKLNTLCILGKKYYERFNYIYHPEYKSTWCDNEFMDVANLLNKQTYIDNVIIKHEHPDWGYGKPDDIHLKNQSDLNYDMSLYNKRKEINFDL